MSTTIKRVALVAVAALSLGAISVAPSNAAPSADYGSYIGDSVLGQQEVNSLATVTITYNDTITAVAVTGVGSVVSAVVATGDSAVSTPTAAGSFTITDADASVDTGTITLTLTSAVAGVQTVTMTPYTSTGTLGTAVTKTVTWVSSLSKNTYDHSYAYLTGETGTAPSVLSADTNTAASTSAAITVPATLNTTQSKAAIWVKQFASGDTSTVSNLASGKGKEVIVEITGAGALGAANNAATGSVVSIAATSSGSSAAQVYVFADGRPGTGTITVKVGGTLLATKTIAFTGTTASYTVGTATTDALSKAYIGVGETATVKFIGLDALKNLSALTPSVTGVSETATVASIHNTSSGNTVVVYGAAAGKTNVYAANTSSLATATIVSPAVAVEITKTTAMTVTFSFDKSSYAPGEKMVLTVSAVDSNGRPVADGARALLSATATANIAPVGTLPGASVTLAGGKAEYTLYAPASSGDLTITATEGTDTDSTTKGTVSKTVSVVNPALDLATDAANEAAQAASDATDAALAAADAADIATAKAQEALDAVNDLANTVTTLIADLKSQIKTLSNLVTKIAKKVKA